MARFVVRNTTGGSALRDGNTLREGWALTTFQETLSDSLAFTAGADFLTDENGNLIVDESGAPVLVGDLSGDRQAMRAAVPDTLVLSDPDSGSGGTHFSVSGASALTFTTITGETFGSHVGSAYTHAASDRVSLFDESFIAFNVVVVPLVTAARTPWGLSQRWNAWAELVVNRQVMASSADDDFQLLSGRVTEDLSRSVTADVSLDLGLTSSPSARHPLLPTRLGDLLDPNNHTHVRVFAGYEGSEVQMGVFDLATCPITVDPSGTKVSITGMSLERTLQRAGFWETGTFGAGARVDAVIVSLVRGLLGADLTMFIEQNDSVIPETTCKPGDDRLGKVTEMAQAAAMEFRFDRLGRVELRNAPSAASWHQSNASWTLSDGLEQPVATLISAVREFTDEESYNGVIVEGSGHQDDQTAPIYYALWITNPSSPLYFDPNYPGASRRGPRPKHIRNEMVTTLEGAVGMAHAELARSTAVVDAVTAVCPANPEIRIGLYARLRSRSLDVDGVYRVVRVAHDLSGGPAEVLLHRYQQVV